MSPPTIATKRIYEPAVSGDGLRVLVDRVWPRGVSKERASLDHWIPDVGPSTELRKWFGHDPERFVEFAARYRRELEGSDALAELVAMARDAPVLTLLFSAADPDHNQAVVLADVITERLERPG